MGQSRIERSHVRSFFGLYFDLLIDVKKGLVIFLLVIAGIIAAVGLVIAAIIEIVEAIIAVLIWGIIIGGGYLWVKKKTD